MSTSTNGSLPQPLVFAPSQRWDGNDGHWSTFIVRIGQPEQNFAVLPASTSAGIIVPHRQGCLQDVASTPNCGDLRGVYDFKGHPSPGFQSNGSSSWNDMGIYGVEMESRLGYAVNGSYGRDTVGLMVQNSGGPSMTDQVVGSIAKSVFYVGLFGLDPRPLNFSDFDYPQRSYISTLKDEEIISSISYGYTAGSYYKSPKVFGSLTLGGYDESRFVQNDISFPFDPNDSWPTSLKLQRITASDTLNGSMSLLDDETYVYLDFTVPHLWLPRETCDRFESMFGLRYDSTSDLYLVNDTIHAELLARNPIITFGLGASTDPAGRVNIALPYAAFDLQASYPIYQEPTNYFPIRRANDSQYTLGRTFMQEAYIVVDHERGNFSVHQARFPPSNEQNIVAIYPKNHTNDITTNTPKNRLSTRYIVAIIVGVIGLIVLCATLTLVIRRRRKATRSNTVEETICSSPVVSNTEDKEGVNQAMSKEIYEICDGFRTDHRELDGDGKHELGCIPSELPGHVRVAELETHLSIDRVNLSVSSAVTTNSMEKEEICDGSGIYKPNAFR